MRHFRGYLMIALAKDLFWRGDESSKYGKNQNGFWLAPKFLFKGAAVMRKLKYFIFGGGTY